VERRYGITTGERVEDGDGVARIREVQPESPAAEAGLRPGQSIAAADDEPVRSRIDFHIALIDRRPGDRLHLALRDGDQPLRRVLTLGERPRPDGAKLLRERLGVVAQRLDARMARALGIARLRGLLVETVEPDSPAARVGLQRGDVIVQLGRHQPESLEDVGELLEQLEPGQRIAVAVLRVSGRTIYRLSAALTVR
jgi:S1-C subfamily serine protease